MRDQGSEQRREGWIYARGGKRLCDIILGTILAVASFPLLVVTSLAVWFRLGRPVLFLQERTGLNGKPFRICKFRTMLDRRGDDGAMLPDAQRLTTVGSFLRRTSLDELPELLNVLRGQMSLVGPRPLVSVYADRYEPWQRRRHLVRPGITGWAQVNGRNEVDWTDRFRMDVWYVENLSFALDLKILVRTAGTMLSRRGIAQPGQATMSEFKGTP